MVSLARRACSRLRFRGRRMQKKSKNATISRHWMRRVRTRWPGTSGSLQSLVKINGLTALACVLTASNSAAAGRRIRADRVDSRAAGPDRDHTKPFECQKADRRAAKVRAATGQDAEVAPSQCDRQEIPVSSVEIDVPEQDGESDKK